MGNMSRFIVAGIFGLALAGCAQTKTKLAKDGPPPVPVALTPVPSIYDSINRGVGNKKVQDKTLKETSASHWAGRVREPGTRDTATAPAVALSSRPKTFPVPRVLPTPGGGEPVASAAGPNGGETKAITGSTGTTDAVEPVGPGSSANPMISANGLEPIAEPAPDPELATASATHSAGDSAAPSSAEAAVANRPSKEEVAAKDGAPATDPLLGPNPQLMPMPADLPASATNVAQSPAAEKPTPEVAAPAEPAQTASTESKDIPKTDAPSPAAPAQAASSSSGDPLLGPNPELMPVPGLDTSKDAPTADPAKLPSGPAVNALPEPSEPALPALASPDQKTPSSGPAGPEDKKDLSVSTDSPQPKASDPSTPDPKTEKAVEPLPTIPSLDQVQSKLPELPALPAAAEPAKDAEAKESVPPTGVDPPAPASPETKPAPAPAAKADDEGETEEIPVVGTAKDENGEEFDLPQLPGDAQKPAGLPGAGNQTDKGTASKADTQRSTTDSQLADPKQAPASTPSAMNPNRTPDLALAASTNHVDPGVRQVAASPTEVQTAPISRNVKEAGRAAAGVGEEVITLNDLVVAVKEFRKKHPSQQPPSKEEMNAMGKGILLMLIERSLLTQEAKRVLKNPKMLDQLMAYAEKAWNEEEVPPLLRKYYASNVYELKDKMAADNRSLDSIHESFRKDFLAQAFLQQKIGGRLKVELPEMLKYYQDHAKDAENQRPATITWREILVESKKYASPQQAREKAQLLVERLRKGENFAKLAKAESDGPSLSKSAGGLMETSPGSYGVAPVNAALESLPIGKVSDIIEGSGSYHIIVVEKRRAAGPASFEELQDQIRKSLHEEKVQKERIALITKLREKTVVWTIFDNTESDPYR